MDDLISRQAALDIYDDYNIAAENGELGAYRKHRKRLLELPSAQPEQTNQWVYVKDRLPETVLNFHTQDYQEYICLCDFGRYGYDVRTYKFGDGHFWNGGHDVDRHVIAWQPLPEIPDTLRLNHQEGGMDD